jgi:hypothetical protein
MSAPPSVKALMLLAENCRLKTARLRSCQPPQPFRFGSHPSVAAEPRYEMPDSPRPHPAWAASISRRTPVRLTVREFGTCSAEPPMPRERASDFPIRRRIAGQFSFQEPPWHFA